MTELLIACIGGIVVVATTGYAFGTVRRRRAVKELLEIRREAMSRKTALGSVSWS